jgi:hypothetical protein
MNDTLLGKQNTFSSVSRLPTKGFSCKFTPRTNRAYAAKDISVWLASNEWHFIVDNPTITLLLRMRYKHARFVHIGH